MQETIIVKNRKNIDMSVRVTVPDNAMKLVFIEHGLSGSKDENHILIVEQKFAESGYIVVNMDATNSLNESGSSLEGISSSSHYNDLEDVINWAKEQAWYKEPFALVGHSLGACSVVCYAENFPEKVDLLLPLSFPYIKGSNRALMINQEELKDFKEKGFMMLSSSRMERQLNLPYSFMEELEYIDFSLKVANIKARTVLIIGDLDYKLSLEDNQRFLDLLQCEKELYILPNVPHVLARTEENAVKFSKALDKILE